MVDVNDIDISRHFGEGTVGVDGGIELAHPPDFLARMDVQTIKNVKQSGKKSVLGVKSEVGDFNTEKHKGGRNLNRKSEGAGAASCSDNDNIS